MVVGSNPTFLTNEAGMAKPAKATVLETVMCRFESYYPYQRSERGQMEKASGLSPAMCGFESLRSYQNEERKWKMIIKGCIIITDDDSMIEMTPDEMRHFQANKIVHKSKLCSSLLKKWNLFHFLVTKGSSGVERLVEAQRGGGSNPSPSTKTGN